MRNLIAILALTIMTSAYADDDYYCDLGRGKKSDWEAIKKCQKGDILIGQMRTSGFSKYCEQNSLFYNRPYSTGNDVCIYRGEPRKKR